MSTPQSPVVSVQGLRTVIGDRVVHEAVSFDIHPGEIVSVIGGSGTGKTTLLRCILHLQAPDDGDLFLFGQNVWQADDIALAAMRRQIGMLFQGAALFSGLNILENIMFPMRQHCHFSYDFMRRLALLKTLMVGLSEQDALKMPAELSGGMKKRAAAARAIALEPRLLILDEPVAGLDQRSAKAFDQLIKFLRDNLGITILMVSHDLGSIRRSADRVLFLGEGQVLADGTLQEVMAHKHSLVRDYFD